MGDFEPPKYLASLIAAVNDGAKSAQAGAVLFLAVGLYLLATAFSATDEDLLLGKTVTISQIGASLPASFSFAIAPAIFVFLHIYALVRYDLLAANVRQFVKELDAKRSLISADGQIEVEMQESDRERCRQLLANVEFIVALTAPPHVSELYSRVWPGLFRGIVAVFPVMVLLLVQINALRYQSDLIVSVQRATLALDLMVLVWFFRRNALDRLARRPARPARRLAGLLVVPVFIMAVNWLYLSTVPGDANARLVRYDPTYPANPGGLLSYAFGNPLDLMLCPWLDWGCRFLRVDHRTLIDKTWDEKALGVLRMNISNTAPGGDAEQKATTEQAAIAAIEGVFLRNRSLRFAVMAESRLYVADLIHADLRSADLSFANLSFARLRVADLSGANLNRAKLNNADLRGANLLGVNLLGANLSDADLSFANLNDANLTGADLRVADLSLARLRVADLSGANLNRAKLNNADLRGANLSGANLSGATLNHAKLNNADLRVANLSGANLSFAELFGANLEGATLSRASLSRASLSRANLTGANLSFADLLGATLEGATLSGASLSGANLTGANLSGANLSGAKNLTQAQLDAACGEPPKLAADSGLQWDAKRPCPEEPVVAPPLNQDATP